MESQTEPKNKRELIKKLVLIALLAAVLVFLFIEREDFSDKVNIMVDPDRQVETYVSTPLSGSHVVEQTMTAQNKTIGPVSIMFSNPEKSTAKGRLTLDLIDSAGEVVATTGIDAENIKANDYAKFLLGGDSESLNANRIVSTLDKSGKNTTTSLVKGAKYTLRLTVEDVESEGPFEIGIITYADGAQGGQSSGDTETMTLDGAEVGQTSLNCYVQNRVYSKKTIVLFLIVIFIAVIFVLLPFRKIDAKVAELIGREDFILSKWITRLMFFASPVVAFFIIQKFVGFGIHRFLVALFSLTGKGVLNLIIIGFVWYLIYTITNSTRFTAMMTVLLGAVFGFVNYILILFRDTPLIATDFAQMGTAMQVADTYQITYTKYFLWAVVLTVIWCVACYALPKYPGKPLKMRFVHLAILILWAGVFYYTFFVSTFLEDNEFRVSSFKPGESYIKNGCALSFVITVKNSIVDKPDGYSAEEIEEIAAKYPSDAVIRSEGVDEKTPNIIVVMNESFSDMAALGELETNEDYLPFYRSLKENTIKGWMNSSVFGGSTANSEFEFLTSFSMRYLPFQSVPFRSVIREETPSFTDYLKSMGYGGNIAFHPGMRDSYNRDNVYPLLGFDEHISYEDLEDPEKIRDYVSDEYDYKYVESEYEKFREENPDTPFYMFNVTIQNHGGYAYNKGIVDSGIEILSTDSQYELAGQFLNLMKKSDEALEQLIDYYSNVDEDTIIVFYGDHQPRLETEFFHSLRVQHEDLNDFEWSVMKHDVPFMIWANYDITGDHEDDQGIQMSANYMAPYLKSVAGMPLTGFDKYLLDLYKEYPVVTEICYKDAKGDLYDPKKPSDYDDRIAEYSRIQYNGLIDTKNRVESLFALKQ